MNRPFSSRLRAALLGLVAACAFAAPRADAASAVLAKDGTLYEVFATTYGQVISGASAADASTPVVALRTTVPDRTPSVEVVGGSFSPILKFGESLEFDDSTQTVFVVYSSLQVQGFFADTHLAIWRDGGWANVRFISNPGLYFSVNPRILVTRQSYKTFDPAGDVVTKTRSILSIVWWEESALSQARYAALLIEDGALRLEDIAASNLNELTGSAGPTDNRNLPTSSYMYPAVQRDPRTEGGVIVSFANLAKRVQQVLHISFPDDYTQPAAGATASAGRTANSRSTPIGRGFAEFPLPSLDLPFTLQVGTIVSPGGVPTYWWVRDGALNYQSGDAGSLARPPLAIAIRSDFPVDRALAVVGSMAEKQ